MDSYSTFAKEKLSIHIQEFDNRLRKYLQEDFANLEEGYHKTRDQVREIFADIILRPAKRLRGSFVVESYTMFGGKDLEVAYKAGIAVEMMHAYLLLIDDFQDKSDTRRTQPSAHRMFEQYHKDDRLVGDALHYGYGQAVLSGLVGQHSAQKLLLSLNLPLEVLVKAADRLNDSIIITAYGQARDIYNSQDRNCRKESVHEVHRLKTAHYTYMSPLQVGSTLACATDSQIEGFNEYAKNAGIAFQIQDDVLGVFGDPKDTGKSNMDDIKEGKGTLLMVYALENATPSQKEVLLSALGNSNLDLETFEKIQQIIIDTGSLQYSKDTAHKLVTNAKESFTTNFSEYKDTDSYKFIAGIADYMIERKL